MDGWVLKCFEPQTLFDITHNKVDIICVLLSFLDIWRDTFVTLVWGCFRFLFSLWICYLFLTNTFILFFSCWRKKSHIYWAQNKILESENYCYPIQALMSYWLKRKTHVQMVSVVLYMCMCVCSYTYMYIQHHAYCCPNPILYPKQTFPVFRVLCFNVSL